MKKWMDYEFYDKESGEAFFVELDENKYHDARAEAVRIAKENFEHPVFVRRLYPEEADILGYDTY